MTFSLLGRCDRSHALGMVVTSSSPAVAARCAFARAGVGLVATQNVTDPRLGPKGLDWLQGGLSAKSVIDHLIADAPHAEWRQLAVLTADGDGAFHHGAKTLGTHGGARGQDCVAAGNLLAGESVPAAMVSAFEASDGADLGDRLIAALSAGLAAGGEAGPVHSAGMLMVRDVTWPVADLRIDWSESPIADLSALWDRWKPEMDGYVTRALDPDSAPSYGVPGDPGDGVV